MCKFKVSTVTQNSTPSRYFKNKFKKCYGLVIVRTPFFLPAIVPALHVGQGESLKTAFGTGSDAFLWEPLLRGYAGGYIMEDFLRNIHLVC